MKATLSLFVSLLLTNAVLAQTPKPTTTPTTPAADAKPTLPPATPPKTGPKPYKEVITNKAQTQRGLFTVHKLDDKYYFEIADSLIGREFMAVTRVSKAPTGAGYGGELANQTVLKFEKGPENKVFLKVVTLINVSPDTAQAMYQAVKNSNVEPITAAFDVKAARKDTSTVIDVTDFFKGDNQVVSLLPSSKTAYRFSGLASDRSYIQKIGSYPIRESNIRFFIGTVGIKSNEVFISIVTAPATAAAGKFVLGNGLGVPKLGEGGEALKVLTVFISMLIG